MKRIALSLVLVPLSACQVDNPQLPARTVHVIADYDGDHAEFDTRFPAVDFGSSDVRCKAVLVGGNEPSDWNCLNYLTHSEPVPPNPVVATIDFRGTGTDQYLYVVDVPTHDGDPGQWESADPGAPARVPMLESWTDQDTLGTAARCTHTALPCSVTITVAR
jgi:hypothetical protein